MHSRFQLTVVVAALIASVASAGEVIAVTFSGNVHRIDNNSVGLAAFIGSSGFTSLNALAKSADGRFIASSGGNASLPAKLIKINRLTGAGTLLGTLAINGDVRGLAFDVDGTLLAIVRTTASSLYRIDPATLAPTLIGATGLSGIQALAVSPQGVLYGWDAGSNGNNGLGLIKLSPVTGLATDVSAANGGDATIQSLGFDEVGTLYGLRHELYRINTSTGATLQLPGTNADDFRGFEYLEAMTHLDGALGVTNLGLVARLNTHTGDITIFGSGAVGSLQACARRPITGQFFAISGTSQTSLYFVNPNTGVLSFDLFLPPHDVHAMAIDATDTLYYVGDDANAAEGLWKAPFIGASQFVGPTGLTDVRALADSPFGVLYGWDAVAGLVIIDAATGAGSDVNPAINGQSFECLAFDPTGRLIAANDSSGLQAVYEVNVVTGATTVRGVFPIGDLRGIAFFSEYEFQVPSTYCTAQTNSQGCVPAIGFAGPNVPSATLDRGFSINAHNVISGKPGLFFYGLNGRASTPFLGGTLCMTTPVRRTPVAQSAGPNTPCGGVFTLDFNAYIASGANPQLVGGIVDGQWWSRDPASPSTTNLTNAIEFEIAP